MVNIFRIGLLVVSWSTVFFLPKKAFQKYVPVANMASSIILLTSLFSLPYKLWIVEGGGMKGKLFTDLSLILGLFFTGTLWIFHLTYGKFYRYLLLNMVMYFLLAYPLCYIFQKLKMFKLVHFRPKNIFITYVFYSLAIYGYQLFLDKKNF